MQLLTQVNKAGLQSTTWSYMQDNDPLSSVGLWEVISACWAELHGTNFYVKNKVTQRQQTRMDTLPITYKMYIFG